jgi:hypothetical protein
MPENCPVHANRKLPVQLYVKIQILFEPPFEYANEQITYHFWLNRNYSAILATLQITSYALGVKIALLFTCQLHESLIKLYFKKFSIFQLKF